MNIYQKDEQNKTLYIELEGEIDHHNTERLRAGIERAYESSDCRDIVFDFSKVTFMDSSGIGLIIGRYKNAGKRGGKVSIAGMTAEIARIYRISGLAKIVESYESVEHAKGR